MRFLIDAQLPPALAEWLCERGHQAEHVAALGLAGATDQVIARRAADDAAILVSKDEDFLTLRLPDRFAFLWLRIGNATNRSLFAWLAPRWSGIAALLAAGERLVEVR